MSDELDLAIYTRPKSDRFTMGYFVHGPETFTVRAVDTNGPEGYETQIYFEEVKDRVYHPGAQALFVLVALWGANGRAYVGRRMTLAPDYGAKRLSRTGETLRISHLSHIDGGKQVWVRTGKNTPKAPYDVHPLPMDDAAAAVDEPGLIAQIHQTRTVDEITALAEHLKTIDAPAAAMEAARKQWANLTKQNGTEQS